MSEYFLLHIKAACPTISCYRFNIFQNTGVLVNVSLFRRNILHVDFITCDRENENASIFLPGTLRIHLLLAPLSQESVSPHARNGTNVEYLNLNYYLGGRLDWVGLPGVKAQKIQG